MDYEKAYKDALERAKGLMNKGHYDLMPKIFPELTESEDEKTKREIINFFRCQSKDEPSRKKIHDKWITWLEKQDKKEALLNKESTNNALYLFSQLKNRLCSNNEYDKDILGAIEYCIKNNRPLEKEHIAWLEKQGEQKPADKIEPKFKVGDWVVFNGFTLLVNEVVQGYYRTIDIGGIPNSYDWNIDNIARLWSIEDAKDGDMLTSKHNQPFIYNGIFDEESVGAYCGIDKFGNDFLKGIYSCDWSYKEGVKPATKEQCDKLKKAINDAGYKWNSEKKKLSEIKQETVDKVEPKFKVGDWIVQKNIGVFKIIEICESWYEVIDTEGFHYSISFVREYMCHLWSINDAKDGDGLSYVTDEDALWIMIYWSLYEPYEGHVHYHALLVNDNFCDKGTCCICIDNLKPSTKEQRDLLFQKMKEAGYEWDADTKQLKKISQRMISAEAKEALYDKVNWSEEDRLHFGSILNMLKTEANNALVEQYKDCIYSDIKWLDTIKERLGGKK